jgi:hypothetical protein
MAIWFLFLGVFAIFSAGKTAAEQVTVGNAKVVVKTVTGLFEGDLRQLKLQDDVYHNEIIETEAESATQITFVDETTLTLGPSSKVVLDKFVYDPDPSKASFAMTATQGVFRFASGKLPKKAYKINTPAATIGIRGTVIEVAILPAGAAGESDQSAVEIVVTQGEARVLTCEGQEIELTSDQPAARITHGIGEACPDY